LKVFQWMVRCLVITKSPFRYLRFYRFLRKMFSISLFRDHLKSDCNNSHSWLSNNKYFCMNCLDFNFSSYRYDTRYAFCFYLVLDNFGFFDNVFPVINPPPLYISLQWYFFRCHGIPMTWCQQSFLNFLPDDIMKCFNESWNKSYCRGLLSYLWDLQVCL